LAYLIEVNVSAIRQIIPAYFLLIFLSAASHYANATLVYDLRLVLCDRFETRCAHNTGRSQAGLHPCYQHPGEEDGKEAEEITRMGPARKQ
jgi:hypothetical protein